MFQLSELSDADLSLPRHLDVTTPRDAVHTGENRSGGEPRRFPSERESAAGLLDAA